MRDISIIYNIPGEKRYELILLREDTPAIDRLKFSKVVTSALYTVLR